MVSYSLYRATVCVIVQATNRISHSITSSKLFSFCLAGTIKTALNFPEYRVGSHLFRHKPTDPQEKS